MKKSLALLSVLLLLFTGCKPWDSEADFGNLLIYIPQAMSDGGISADYPVPSGGGSDTWNFRADDDGIHIILGVLRSGKQKGEAFSVKVHATDSDFPAYTLPERVDVASGENGATFCLDLPLSVLDDFAGAQPSITVSLSDPTLYELSSRATSVRIVVDIDALSELIR